MKNIELDKEIKNYESIMNTYFPILKMIEDIKSLDFDDKEKLSAIAESSMKYSPKKVYSTTKGKQSYAFDNPIKALLYGIFTNQNKVIINIKENLDKNKKYQGHYELDERVENELANRIKSKNITLYIYDDNNFTKPETLGPLNRTWITNKNATINKEINVNIKDFLNILEKNKPITYNKYKKSKDWETVINLLTKNYPYGIYENFASNIETYDKLYTNFIEENFKDKLEFSILLQDFIKRIIFKSKNDKIEKLKYINDLKEHFLTKKEDGTYIPNETAINDFIIQEKLIEKDA